MVEVVVATVLFGLLMVVVFIALRAGLAQVEADSPRSQLQAAARIIVDEVAGELRRAGLDTLVPANPNNSGSISFQIVSGYDAGTDTVTYDPDVVQYRFQADAADPVNGVDDDNDGVVDDGLLVRQVTGRLPVILTTLVASGDFTVTLQGEYSTAVTMRN